jgi:transposase InsO family protein
VSRAEARGEQREIDLDALPAEVQIAVMTRIGAGELGSRGAEALGSGGAGAQETGMARRVLTPEILDSKTGLSDAETWSGAREADRAVAIRRASVLDAREAYITATSQGRRNRTALGLAFCAHWNAIHPAEEQLAQSTLDRWAPLYHQRGLVGLLPGYVIGEKRDIPEEILGRFNRAYLSNRKLTVALSREIVRGEFALAGSPLEHQVPSAATLRRHVATIPRAVVILAREGDEAYHRECEPHLERDYLQIPVMSIWVSDHMQFDHWRRGAKGTLVRPWVTAWLDVRSRRRVGWCIAEGPSQDTVLASLAMGILRFGIPGMLYTDNGREYCSETMAGPSRRFKVALDKPRVTALVKHLDTTWSFSIPENPQSRGMIERAFGVDHERFDKLQPTYCGRNPETRPEGLTELLAGEQGGRGAGEQGSRGAGEQGRGGAEAIGTMDELRAEYAAYCEQVANEMPHEGRGMDGRSPRQMFESEAYIKRTATVEELRLMFMRSSKPVTVDKQGVFAFDRYYRSDPLALHQGEKVGYRYRLDDISELDVYTLDDQYLCTVQRKELSGGASADHRQMASERKRQKRVVRAFYDTKQQIADHPDQLTAIIAARKADEQRGRGAEAHGRGGAEATGGGQKVIMPIRTPFAAAVKAKGIDTAARAKRVQTTREARKIARELFPRQPDAPESTAQVLPAEGSSIVRKLFTRHS